MYGFSGLYGMGYGITVSPSGVVGSGNSGGGSSANYSVQAQIDSLKNSLNRANATAKSYYQQLESAKKELQAALAEVETLKAQLTPTASEGGEGFDTGEASTSSTAPGIPTWAIVGGAVAATAAVAYFIKSK